MVALRAMRVVILFLALTGAGCGALYGKGQVLDLIVAEMQRISQKTHENWPGREFRVSVPACDVQTLQAYREVLKEMGYEEFYQFHESSVLNIVWSLDTVKYEYEKIMKEDLIISCWNVESEKEKRSEIRIYSKSIYNPGEPKHKERIHQKVLERLKKPPEAEVEKYKKDEEKEIVDDNA